MIGGLGAGLEEPGVDPLTDDDVGELQIVLVDSNLREAVLDCLDLVLHHVGDLTMPNSVPVEDDLGEQVTVEVSVYYLLICKKINCSKYDNILVKSFR